MASSWGRQMRASAVQEVLRGDVAGAGRLTGGVSPALLSLPPLRIGTDCSGADAPIWALRALDMRYVHQFACDSWQAAETVILANSHPHKFFHDVCARNPADVPEHDVYVCGFPCQPFSRLHNKRAHFKEAKAAPFKAMLRMLRARRPRLVVLENVAGILDVQEKLDRALRSLKVYRTLMLRLDPTMFGDLVRRPRVYMLLLRLDSLVHASAADTRAVAERVLAATTVSTMLRRATDMLAPPVHNRRPTQKGAGVSARLSHSGQGERAGVSARKRRAGIAHGGAHKWMRLHQSIRANVAHGCRNSSLAASIPGLTERERDGLEIALRQHPSASAVDVSQSAGRMPVAFQDGPLPTMTPGGRVVLVKFRRLLTGADKLSLAAFPMQRLQLPATLTERDLHILGGNTMHVKCVAAALLVGLALVSLGAGVIVAKRQPARTPLVGEWPKGARFGGHGLNTRRRSVGARAVGSVQ